MTTELSPGERRVALVPASAAQLIKLGAAVIVQAGAGLAAGFPDESYTQAGASVVASREEVIRDCSILVQVRAANANPGAADLQQLRPGQILIAQCDPLADASALSGLASRQALVFALELLPRTSRAQAMDVLSSMATLAGYKAVLLAANLLPQMFPLLMTAAGTLAPARVLVIGAGVAGLQAIATAKRLGAVVSGYDVRPAVKEQVNSLGAKFVELPLQGDEGQGGYAKETGEEFLRRQRELLAKTVAASDVVITTAAIPGAKAPLLVSSDMAHGMPAGSVIVDLAAERGGNCELTRPGETVQSGNVTIIGPLNLAGELPRHASQMFSNNVTAFVKNLIKKGKLSLNLSDDIIAATLVTHQGQVVHPLIRKLAGLPEALDPHPDSQPTPADENVFRIRG